MFTKVVSWSYFALEEKDHHQRKEGREHFPLISSWSYTTNLPCFKSSSGFLHLLLPELQRLVGYGGL